MRRIVATVYFPCRRRVHCEIYEIPERSWGWFPIRWLVWPTRIHWVLFLPEVCPSRELVRCAYVGEAWKGWVVPVDSVNSQCASYELLLCPCNVPDANHCWLNKEKLDATFMPLVFFTVLNLKKCDYIMLWPKRIYEIKSQKAKDFSTDVNLNLR